MSDQQAPGERKLTTREMSAIALGLVVITLCIANRRSVKVDWIVGTSRLPLIILIVGCLAIGAAGGYLVARRRAKPKDD